ncbi:hypothetical protein ASE86_12300 [Sphingomonas sp. Leaf33]|nr:hypothetical protein ASE86_12300 [Sphingomonas sp. Leaf33]
MDVSDRLDFDSDAFPEDLRFERYRTLYGIMTEVLLTGPAMRARVRAWRLDRILIYDRRLHDVGHSRVPERLAADNFDHFTVTLLISGGITFRCDGTTRRLQPGEAIILSTAIPYENRMDNAHVVTISIARDRLTSLIEDVDALQGVVLPAARVRLLQDTVLVLLQNLPDMARTVAKSAADMLIALLAVVIDNSGIDRGAAQSAEAERLAQLRRIVETHLGDAEFDVAALIRLSGLSRSTLYRTLAAQGGVQAFIRSHRLEHLRRRLADPAETRSFSALASAAGFDDTNDANRAFFDRYGARPGMYRQVIAAGSGVDSLPTLRLWLSELR